MATILRDSREKWKHEPREDSRTYAYVFVGLQSANGHPSGFWDSVSYTVTGLSLGFQTQSKPVGKLVYGVHRKWIKTCCFSLTEPLREDQQTNSRDAYKCKKLTRLPLLLLVTSGGISIAPRTCSPSNSHPIFLLNVWNCPLGSKLYHLNQSRLASAHLMAKDIRFVKGDGLDTCSRLAAFCALMLASMQKVHFTGLMEMCDGYQL